MFLILGVRRKGKGQCEVKVQGWADGGSRKHLFHGRRQTVLESVRYVYCLLADL